MEEHQVVVKKNIVSVGYYDKKTDEILFTFTKDESLLFLDDLKVKYKYEVVK